MLASWSLRYSTKAECCGEPVSLVGPIVLLTNLTSDHISSALGKSPSWNGSAALAGSPRRSASADSEAPDPAKNLRRETAIVSSTALLLSTAPNDPLSWATLSPSDRPAGPPWWSSPRLGWRRPSYVSHLRINQF